MIELEENIRFLNELNIKLNHIKDSMKINELTQELKKLDEESTKDDFWNDQANSSKVFARIKSIQRKINGYENIVSELNNLKEMNELLNLEPDQDLLKELLKNSDTLKNKLDDLEIQTLFSGKYDSNNAIITLHPGAGGTESQDWAEMLYRMYSRWANKNGFLIKELDYLDGDEAGIKSVTALISGENAYGYLKGEMGVHRLVRISPFDSGGRRHTSFASLEVLPEITDDIEIDIDLNDLRIDILYNDEIDHELERENLLKEKDKLEQSIERRKKLLSNENYINKAPANVVENDRIQLEKERLKLEEILTKLN